MVVWEEGWGFGSCASHALCLVFEGVTGSKADRAYCRSTSEAKDNGCFCLCEDAIAHLLGERNWKQRLGQQCTAWWFTSIFSYAGCCHSKGFSSWLIAPRSRNRAFPRFYLQEMLSHWRRRNALRWTARKVSRKVSFLLLGDGKCRSTVHIQFKYLWCRTVCRELFWFIKLGIVYPLKAKFRNYLRLLK